MAGCELHLESARRRSCLDCNRKYQREWAAQDRSAKPDRSRLAKTKYLSKPENRKKAVAYTANYRKANPEKSNAYFQARRARLLAAPGVYTVEDWQSIVDRQNGRCAACDKQCVLTVDHIVPLKRGGTNWPSNLQGLCLSCNCSKGARLESEWRGCYGRV